MTKLLPVSLHPKLRILKVELAGSKGALHKLPGGARVSPILTPPEPLTWVSKKGLELPDKGISCTVTQPCSYRYRCGEGGGGGERGLCVHLCKISGLRLLLTFVEPPAQEI